MATNNLVDSPFPTVPAKGGTGLSSLTAYAPICAGTSSTGNFQQASSGIATTGYVLTSTGASSLPTWQSASGAAGLSIGVYTYATVNTGATTVTAVNSYNVSSITYSAAGSYAINYSSNITIKAWDVSTSVNNAPPNRAIAYDYVNSPTSAGYIHAGNLVSVPTSSDPAGFCFIGYI